MVHIQPFSSQYYMMSDLSVSVRESIDTSFVWNELYARIQDMYYGSVSTPIVLRHNRSGRHIVVEPRDEVPYGTIWLSDSVVDDVDSHVETTDSEQFLLATPECSRTMNDLLEVIQ
jgi:hypothetical protein